jgi:hypothetical protein
MYDTTAPTDCTAFVNVDEKHTTTSSQSSHSVLLRPTSSAMAEEEEQEEATVRSGGFGDGSRGASLFDF